MGIVGQANIYIAHTHRNTDTHTHTQAGRANFGATQKVQQRQMKNVKSAATNGFSFALRSAGFGFGFRFLGAGTNHNFTHTHTHTYSHRDSHTVAHSLADQNKRAKQTENETQSDNKE